MERADLERGLLHRALTDKTFMAHAVSKLGGYRWSIPELGWIWEQTKRYHEDSGEPPTKAILKREILVLPDENQTPLIEAYVGVYKSKPEENAKATLLSILKASRTQTVFEGMERASERFSKGDDEGAVIALEQAVKSREAKPGPQAKKTFPKTLRGVKVAPRIKTGLQALDDIIGGIQRREVGYILGVTGMGKSALTVTFGHSAIKHGLKLLHIDTENGEDISRARYLSRFTQVPSALIEDNTMGPENRERVESWLRRNHERMGNQFRSIYLQYLENTVEEVEAAIAEQIAEDFIPDLVIFDSPDHLFMDGGEARWEKFANVANKLKGITQRLNIGMWATSQADLAYEGKIAGNAAMADSKQKARVSSLVISINQLLDKHGKPIGERKCLHVAKARSRGGRGTIIRLQTHLETMTMHAAYETEDGFEESDGDEPNDTEGADD